MRRKKPRVVWLPTTPENSVGNQNASNFQSFALDVSGVVGTNTVGEIPLVIDGSDSDQQPTRTLSDVENSGYRLRRIVGKIFIHGGQIQEATPSKVLVTVGLIVRRIDPLTQRSMAEETTNGALLSPSDIENIADPWIWRRTWAIGNANATGAVEPDWPPTNFAHGPSALDGPHIDQKTARIVGPEEKLFLDASGTVISAGDPEVAQAIFILTDLRVLASMRVSSGNRRNASR